MRRVLVAGLLLLFAGALVVFPVSAADPHTTSKGQPNQNCEAIFPGGTLSPQGFNTEGFNFATTRYAGSGFTANGNNPKAVSQYDVACFEQCSRMQRQTG
jgi:hypothetical protein